MNKVQTTTLIEKDADKKIQVELKRWLSLYKQASSALKAKKLQRREQLMLECLKSARRFKEMQEELLPGEADARQLADRCLRDSLRELGMNCRMMDVDPADDRCLPYLLEALPLEESAKDGNPKDFYMICDALSSTYVARKEMTRYEEIARRALARKEKEVGQWHPEIVSFLLDVAWSLEEQGKFKESASIKRDALGICEKDPNRQEVDRVALKHGLEYSNLRSQGMSDMQAVQKALESLTEEERKLFTGRVAEELSSLS